MNVVVCNLEVTVNLMKRGAGEQRHFSHDYGGKHRYTRSQCPVGRGVREWGRKGVVIVYFPTFPREHSGDRRSIMHNWTYCVISCNDHATAQVNYGPDIQYFRYSALPALNSRRRDSRLSAPLHPDDIRTFVPRYFAQSPQNAQITQVDERCLHLFRRFIIIII